MPHRLVDKSAKNHNTPSCSDAEPEASPVILSRVACSRRLLFKPFSSYVIELPTKLPMNLTLVSWRQSGSAGLASRGKHEPRVFDHLRYTQLGPIFVVGNRT